MAKQKYEPYDVSFLDEIIVFEGTRGIIEFSREGKYINLIKQGEEDKRYYRYNLQTEKFERVNFYKTVEDKITEVDVKNITHWFTECRLVTKDIHFGRLVVYAKNSYEFDRYSSPVRFIQQLGHPYIKNLEQWEALGVKFTEVEEYFGTNLVWNRYDGIHDRRKDIYLDKISSRHSRNIPYSPSECSKEVLDYVKRQGEISIAHLRNIIQYYNNGEFHIKKALEEICELPEFQDIFEYQENSWRNHGTFNALLDENSYTCSTIRHNMFQVIKEYQLDVMAFCKWIRKQWNVDKNDVQYLFETNHYRDYLACEYELKNGSYSKMVKYPNNFRTEFHKAQAEFEAIHGSFDEFKFARQRENNKELEHTGRKFCMIIPQKSDEIKNEADCLHHCVRSYIKPMSEGRTLIMFMRDKKERNEPLITVEVKNGAVTQAYGIHDSKPKKEHLEYIRHWAEMKNLRMGCWR